MRSASVMGWSQQRPAAAEPPATVGDELVKRVRMKSPAVRGLALPPRIPVSPSRTSALLHACRPCEGAQLLHGDAGAHRVRDGVFVRVDCDSPAQFVNCSGTFSLSAHKAVQCFCHRESERYAAENTDEALAADRKSRAKETSDYADEIDIGKTRAVASRSSIVGQHHPPQSRPTLVCDAELHARFAHPPAHPRSWAHQLPN